MQYPVVSIVMPVFNREKLVPFAIQSIIEQSFRNWECIIIDDGSTDNTKKIICSFCERDSRIRLYDRSNNHLKGPSGCRNQGLDICKGEYVIFFDSDDVVHPDALNICLERITGKDFCHFKKEPFWGEFCLDFVRNIEFEIRDIDVKNIEEIIMQKLGFACCTVMWKKQSLAKERFKENLTYAEEWEYYSRLISSGLKGISIKRTLYYNRKHPVSNTGEFWNNDPVRMHSKVNAVKLIIDNLKRKQLLSVTLVKYFIQLGFLFKQGEIINYTLQKSDVDIWTLWKYKLGYQFYPLLKPLLTLKSKVVKT